MGSQNTKYIFLMLAILIIVPGLGALLIPKFGPFGFFAIAIAFVGGTFVFYAKSKLKARTKLLVEWGSSGMTKKEKAFYFSGYFCLLISVLLIVYGLYKQ